MTTDSASPADDSDSLLEARHGGFLDVGSRRLITRLAGLPWSDDVYLAGSAALALYLGHRRVRDLDIMGYRRLASPERRDMLQSLLKLDPAVQVETARDGYFFLRFSEEGDFGGAGLRIFYYPYPLIDPEDWISDFAVASALDLALMKLGAVISRGHRRDFVDLYLLSRRLPLRQVLERAGDKFGHVRDFPLQALKGLADLHAAGQEPAPRLEVECRWSEVESWVRGEVREVARDYVGLEDDG
ncbi:MAG: nucleotidyl transferase AbiEii/AbiGii toxin family protein [Acidobacteriota bacterium]